jgi:hypothetical protein
MRITKESLFTMANSSNADDRKRAFKLFQALIKAGPSLSFQDRLNYTERYVLTELFISKGLMQRPISKVPPPRARPTGPKVGGDR